MTSLPNLLDVESPRGLADLGGNWDRAILAASYQFALLADDDKARVRRDINADRSWALVGWAEGMATLAVRERSREILTLALIGLSLFDQERVDSRDAELVYALLLQAARLIALDPMDIVTSAARRSDTPGMDWLLRRVPDPQEGIPPTHEAVGLGECFTFRRRDADWDPVAELADFADNDGH